MKLTWFNFRRWGRCSDKAVGCWDRRQAGNGEEAGMAGADRAGDADNAAPAPEAAAAGHRRDAGAGAAPGLELPLMMCCRRSLACMDMDGRDAAKPKMMPNKQASIRIRSSGSSQGK